MSCLSVGCNDGFCNRLETFQEMNSEDVYTFSSCDSVNHSLVASRHD